MIIKQNPSKSTIKHLVQISIQIKLQSIPFPAQNFSRKAMVTR